MEMWKKIVHNKEKRRTFNSLVDEKRLTRGRGLLGTDGALSDNESSDEQQQKRSTKSFLLGKSSSPSPPPSPTIILRAAASEEEIACHTCSLHCCAFVLLCVYLVCGMTTLFANCNFLQGEENQSACKISGLLLCSRCTRFIRAYR